jgi:tetratricopeptide (TPR) repeat protein
MEQSGEWVDALMFLNTVTTLARRKKDPKLEIESELRAGRIFIKRTKWNDAVKRYKRILSMTGSSKSRPVIAECYYGLAVVEWRHGNLDEAKGNVNRAISYIIDGEKDEAGIRSKALILLATIANNTGDTDKAIKTFKEAILVLEERDDLNELARAYNNLGETYKGIGDLPTAVEQYERCMDVAKRSNNKLTEAYGLINAAECLVRDNELDKAGMYVRRAEEILALMDEPYVFSYTHFIRALMAAARKERDTAQKEFELTIGSLEALDVPYDVGITCYEYGQMLRRFGSYTEADVMYKRAIRNFSKVDAKAWLEKVKKAVEILEKYRD